MSTLAAIHRYPVKSMMGEELNAAYVTMNGVLGDRAFALKDEDGKLEVAFRRPNAVLCDAVGEFQGTR